MSALVIVACALASAALLIAVMALVSRRPDPRHEFIIRLIGDLLDQEQEASHEAHRA